MSDTTETRWERHNEAGRRYFAQGEFGQAEEAFKAAIREASLLGAENLRLAASLSNLGQLKYKQKDHAQAEALFRRSLAIREHVLGTEHQGIVQSINNLAALYYSRGELEQAEPLFRRALSISEAQLGPDHADVATALNNLARLSFRRNDTAAAAPLLTRLLELKERSLGDHHPEIAGILLSLVKVRAAAREFGEAESLCRRALGIREGHARSDSDLSVASALEALAEICGAQGKLDEQRHAVQRAAAIRAAAGGTAGGAAEQGSGPHRRPSAERLRQSSEMPATTPSFAPDESVPRTPTGSAPLSQEMPVIGRDVPNRVEPLDVMPVAAQFIAPRAPAAKHPPATPGSPAVPPRSEPQSAPRFSPVASSESDFDAPRAERDRTPSAVARAARSRTPAQQPKFPRRIPTPARLAMAAAAAPADGFDTDSGTLPTPDASPAEADEVREITFSRPQTRRWGVIGGIAAAIALAAVTAWAMVGRDQAEGGASAPVLEGATGVAPVPAARAALPPAPSTQQATAEDSANGIATPGTGSAIDAETGRARDAEEGGATARRPALSSGTAARAASEGDEDREAMPNALSRIGIDKVLRDVEQNAKARVDSASRTIPVKPPTFGRP